MSLFQRGDIWWYEFWFAGRRIRESSKSESKTVAKTAEKNRRRELEEGFNNFADLRQERIRTFTEMADDYFDAYKLRLASLRALRRVCDRSSKATTRQQDAR